MEKYCKKHGLTEFAYRKDGRYRCKKCSVESVQKRRNNLKIKAVEYKGGKCENCGYDKFIGALEFHHTIDDKDFGISAKGYTKSWNIVKKELDKCIMLCSNCHKEVHANIINIDYLIENLKINSNFNKISEATNDFKYCVDCGNLIDRKASRCARCSNINQRKVKNRPSKEEILKMLETSSYVSIGKKYGVSDNTIRKWLK
jgi:5-methylcytosine-specific restriction endonuclease McrA